MMTEATEQQNQTPEPLTILDGVCQYCEKTVQIGLTAPTQADLKNIQIKAVVCPCQWP